MGRFAVLLCMLAAFGAARAELPAELAPVDGQVIWVDFWASWCAPCRRSFPWLNEMQARYGAAGLQIVGVNVDKERKLADEFLEEVPARFALRFDPAGQLAERFEVQAMPSSFVIDRNGRVLAKHYGFRLSEADEYEQTIKSALRNAGGTNGTAD